MKGSAFLNSGLVLTLQGRSNDALAAFSKAVDASPDSVDACNNLGVALARVSQLNKALKAFRQALRYTH